MPDLVPHKHLRARPAPQARALPADVERLLVELAPRLPAESLPTVHEDCVEIPVLEKHPLERDLAALGFAPHRSPHDPKAPQRDAAWRYWRRPFTAPVTP